MAWGKPKIVRRNQEMVKIGIDWRKQEMAWRKVEVITRSDDLQHTVLLQTTGECLGGHTFRSRITRYSDFRNGAIWASKKCLGSCTVQYGGQYQTTRVFGQVACSGDIQSANAIGF